MHPDHDISDPAASVISFNQVLAVDIRIGTILKASRFRGCASRAAFDRFRGDARHKTIQSCRQVGHGAPVDPWTAGDSLSALLGLRAVAVNELRAALDWLLAQQPRIEAKLARGHLGEGTLVLCDVTSATSPPHLAHFV